ncbi:hypothetical protein IV203_024344 [Nitzschia inconspicua]|uniref:Uncharacterized protein n=1 Tax=Nitzschia inconspicua TaxID=303405 RepID=A0A9K3KCR1_9STRA|nr:hypothetical protein IV203_024344 [Nitzschia inconspicua]
MKNLNLIVEAAGQIAHAGQRARRTTSLSVHLVQAMWRDFDFFHVGMIGGVRFSVVEWEEEGSKAIDWDEERNRSKRGRAERSERKRAKKERKFAMEAERERIRGQVRHFLASLADMDNAILGDQLLLDEVEPNLRQLLGGDQDLQVRFRRRFITPGNDVDLAEWRTVQRLQIIMTTFVLHGLYDDPVSAAAEGEVTSDSYTDQH